MGRPGGSVVATRRVGRAGFSCAVPAVNRRLSPAVPRCISPPWAVGAFAVVSAVLVEPAATARNQ